VTEFTPTPEVEKAIDELVSRYPEPEHALLPVLHLLQRKKGWLPLSAREYAAERLGLPHSRVHGVVTFYTMFLTEPPGRFHLQLCMTLPCALRGAAALEGVIREKLGIGSGEKTDDGMFSFVKVECLGSCGTAPVVQINDDYFEGLTPESFARLLDDLAAGRSVKPSNPTHAFEGAE
jgi:NADH-quinone oxidoreductase E subunit